MKPALVGKRRAAKREAVGKAGHWFKLANGSWTQK